LITKRRWSAATPATLGLARPVKAGNFAGVLGSAFEVEALVEILDQGRMSRPPGEQLSGLVAGDQIVQCDERGEV
jgi:hypothetical protein